MIERANLLVEFNKKIENYSKDKEKDKNILNIAVCDLYERMKLFVIETDEIKNIYNGISNLIVTNTDK